MTMRMPVRVAMVVSMVMVAKSHHSDQIHYQPQAAHNKQLSQSFRLGTLVQSLKSLEPNFNAQQPILC
jgi:hypothetical protein